VCRALKELKKSGKASIHREKTQYYKNKFHECKNDSSMTWKVVKTLIPNKTNSSSNYNIEDIESKI